MDPQLFRQQARAQILAAGAAYRPLQIRNSGRKAWHGQQVQDDLLDTCGYSGVIDYEPTELVITARCGKPLGEIEQLLAQHHQMLPFEPMHFGSGLFGRSRPIASSSRRFEVTQADAIRRLNQWGGHATLYRGGDKSVGVFHPSVLAVEQIYRRLKASFDPVVGFNIGRMYSYF